MKLIKTCLLIVSLTITASLLAQEHHQHDESHAAAHEHFQHHRLALFTGYGIIPGAIDEEGEERAKIIPVLGLDYEYWFNHKIGLGVQNDLELTSYTIERDHQDYIDREYAFVTALVFLYEPLPSWSLFLGPGYEFEANHNFPLVKIGTDIGKSFEDGWSVGITLAYDIKEVNSAASVGITVGKRLGK